MGLTLTRFHFFYIMSAVSDYMSKCAKGEATPPASGATPEQIVAAGAAAGFSFSVDDLAKHVADAELDAAGGGSCYFQMGDVSC
jgi:hypothetical protein